MNDEPMCDGDFVPFKAPREIPRIDDGIDWSTAPRTRLPDQEEPQRHKPTPRKHHRKGKARWVTPKAHKEMQKRRQANRPP